MIKNRVFVLCWVFFAATGFLSQGCSTTEVNEDDPKSLYDDANVDIDDSRFIMALETLRKVKSKFPYSKYSALAQLRIADVYFLQDDFVKAAAAYELFRDLHPKHEKVLYASFRIAESYYQDIPGTIARDLATAQNALNSFLDFVTRYPYDTRTADAKKRVKEIRGILAEKEMYIANWYYGQDHYKSALGRYKKVVKLYPETDEAQDARERIPDTEELLAEQEAETEREAEENDE